LPEDLLNRIRGEIDARLAELRPRVEEIPRLEAALVVLEERPQRRQASVNRLPRRQHRRDSGERAPRGANRAALLEAVGDRPGASAAELAKLTAIKITIVRTTLGALLKAGAVSRDEIGGVTGYHPGSVATPGS
jgi:hypothetical protein